MYKILAAFKCEAVAVLASKQAHQSSMSLSRWCHQLLGEGLIDSPINHPRAEGKVLTYRIYLLIVG